MKSVVSTPYAVPPLRAFSQATIHEGKVYASGSIGCDKNYVLVKGGIKAQTRAALENLENVLQAAGSGLQHIIKANVYITDMPKNFMPMNEAYCEYFPQAPPARTCVGVVALPLGAEVEIECVAEIPESKSKY
ncbi:hypothetical protein JAAARDRAFT_180282 [Jaapia argillacea MUCL 33604]|uniref:Uncharacterized protein n=1 Tax=Jaapia argillacea MUCL 33604 TaxID=933084 RepID=A0A067PMT3_9AGAM|nr:hypothetical protein JAAARDRAFT_180282 [Jaapia argillacea MUCL 33604]